jgi:hypothetical protein
VTEAVWDGWFWAVIVVEVTVEDSSRRARVVARFEGGLPGGRAWLLHPSDGSSMSLVPDLEG